MSNEPQERVEPCFCCGRPRACRRAGRGARAAGQFPLTAAPGGRTIPGTVVAFGPCGGRPSGSPRQAPCLAQAVAELALVARDKLTGAEIG